MANDFETPPAMPRKGFTPRMRDWWEDVMDWMVAHRPVGGTSGPLPDAAGGGKLINIPRPVRGATSTSVLPWSPVLITDPSTGTQYFGIAPGQVWPGPGSSDAIGITGVLTSPTPTIDDPGLQGLPSPGEYGWIRLPVTYVQLPGVSSGVLHIETTEANWPGFPDAIEVDPSIDPIYLEQTYLHLLIGYCTTGPRDDAAASWQADGETHCWIQTLDQCVELVARTVDGVLAVVPSNNTQLVVTA